MFSTLLDISSFFIGILINLLLIAMICFYFKKKIDNLELSQSEQAKMLYTMLSSQDKNDIVSNSVTLEDSIVNVSDDIKIVSTENFVNEKSENESGEESDEESDEESGEESDEESDEETGEESDKENKCEIKSEKIITDISLNLDKEEENIMILKNKNSVDYNKMTIKEIRELLENKGKTTLPSRAKKSDLIEMLNDEESDEDLTNVVNDEAVNVMEEVIEIQESNDLLMESTKILFNKNLDISNEEN